MYICIVLGTHEFINGESSICLIPLYAFIYIGGYISM